MSNAAPVVISAREVSKTYRIWHHPSARAADGLRAYVAEKERRRETRSQAWRAARESTAVALGLALGVSWSQVDRLIDLGLGLTAYPQLDGALLDGR